MAEIIPLLDGSEKMVSEQDALFTDDTNLDGVDALSKAISAEYKKVTGPEVSGAQKALNATDQFDSAQFGEAKALGKPLNLPGNVAYDNIDTLKPKKNIITEEIQQVLRNNPEMNALFSDPEFMAVAKDDIGLITRLSDIGQSLQRGFTLGTGMGLKGVGDILETSQEFGKGNIEALIPDVFIEKFQALSQQGLSTIFPEQFSDEDPEKAKAIMSAILFGRGDALTSGVSDVLQWGGSELKELIPELPKEHQTNITQVSEALGQMTGQIAGMIVNPVLGTGMLLGQGVDQQTERIDQLALQGEEFSTGQKLLAQAGGGLITWGTEKAMMPWLTKYLPKSVQDKIGTNFASRALDKIMGRTSAATQKAVGKRFSDALAAGSGEFGQEFLENVLQEVLSRIVLEPDNPMWKGLDDELKFLADTTGQSVVAGEAATVFQLITSFALGKKNRNRLSEQAQADKVNMALGELSDLAKDSKMQSNSVDDFKAFIKARFGDSKFMVDNLGFKTMFQGLKTEEQEKMVENMPYLQDQINQAGELGTDIEIPVEDYAAYIAAEVYHDELARHVTSEYGEMSLAQAELDREIMLSDIQMEIEDQVKESLESDEYSVEQKQVLSHIQNELVRAGQDADASSQQSELFAATVRAYASRGYEAKQIVDAILNISINKSLSTVQSNVDTLTMAIKDVQAGNIPTQPEMFGETLSQFLRKIGINDQGGELSSRDVDDNLAPFVARMIKEDGVDLDKAVEMAVNAGFIENVSLEEMGPEHLLEALDRELAGDTVFSSQNRNEALIKRQEDLEMLREYIDELGMEENTADEIREILQDAVDNTEDTEQNRVMLQGKKSALSSLTKRQEEVVTPLVVQELPPLPADYQLNEEQLEIDFSAPTYEQAVENPEQIADATIMELRNIQGSVLANKIVQDFDAQHATRLVGEAIKTSSDLAALAQIYRNPSFETFRLFLMKDNVIVHQDGITSRKVGSSGIFANNENFSHINHLMETTGADSYYLMHNHPSGKTKSSIEDIGVTEDFAKFVPGFKGHVIINGTEFTTLELNDTREGQEESRMVEKQLPLPEDVQNFMYDLEADPKVASPFIGSPILGSDSIAVIGKQFQQPGFFTLIGRDSQGKVSTIMDMPLSAVDLSPAEIQANINKIALSTGTREFMAANVPDSYREQFNQGLYSGLFIDVTAENGRSYRHEVEPGPSMSGTARRTMFQDTESSNRANIQLPQNVLTEQTIINLFEKNDFSSMLHESGHFFLELQRELAKQGGPAAEDHGVVKDWWLKNVDSLAEESGLTVKQMKKYIKTGKLDTAENEAAADTALHEQFARGFEKYLFTGKAPSVRLQGVFQRFKAWLTQIYKQLKNLNVDIDENITAVFDRMLATDAEIEQAQNDMRYSDVVADSEFLSEEEAEELRQLSIKARDEETAQALKVALRENKYKLTQAYKKRREVVRREVEQDVTSRKPFRAQKMILFGYDPDGNPIDAKLNLKALKSLVGKSAVAALGKKFSYGKYGVTRKDGVDPVQVANYLDYGTVDLMIDDLLSMPKLKDQVEAETDERMTQEFQAKEFRASEEAIALVHGNQRERLLDAELQTLSTQIGVRKQSSKIIKDAARRVVAKLTMKNLQPYRYKQAETKAARDVEKALLDGNIEAAREAKYRQLKNFHLFTETTKAKEQAELDQKMLNKYRKRSVRKVVDNTYLEQIDGLLFNFELRPNISLTAQMKSRQVQTFLTAQENEGHTVYISKKMASQIASAEKQHYKEMSVTEFNELVKAVKWLRHLSDTKTGLKAEQEERAYQEEKEAILFSIHENSPLLGKGKISRSSLTKKLGKMFSIGHAELLLPEAFAKLVDGDKIGAFYNAFFKPISDAADVAGQWKLDVGKRFNDTAKKYYSKLELARFGGLSARRVHIKGIDEYLSKEEILGVALNTGNENNRFKLLDGRQWNEGVLTEILDHLDGNDWNFVQDIWNLIDSEFKQKLSDLELKMEGLPMDMVEPTPFTNQYGTFNGGYYPIVYESDTVKTSKHADAKTYKELMGMNVAKTTTRSGAVEARVEQTGFAIRLDFSTILANHVNEMIQDITHRESVMKVYKIINDPDISLSLVDTFGIDTYRTLQQWLGDSAGAGRDPAGKFAKVARHMRVGVSVVSMGMSVMTALQNYTGLFVSMNEVPTGKLLKSFIKMHYSVVPAIAAKTVGWTAKKIGVPPQLVAKYVDKMVDSPYLYIAKQKEILALSPYIKNRAKIFDHDINEELRGLSVSGQLTPSKSFIFGLIAMVDKAVVIPTWEAAYEDATVNKGMEQGEAITHADSVVRMTQGSGRQVDLSRIAADPGIASLFTNFFSYFNAMYSRYWSTYRNTRIKGIRETWPRVLSEITFTWIVSSLLAEFLAGRMPDTDDEDWDNWALRNLVLYPAMTIPLFRDIATSAYAKLDDSAPDYGYTLSPVEMGMSDFITGTTAIVDKIANDDEIKPQEVKSMFKAAGFWLHLPGTQAYRTGEHFYNWMAGESDFSLYDATYGEKKK